MKLSKLVESRRQIRVMGVDDAHYADKSRGAAVNYSGVVCSEIRFEGMVWGSLTKDGLDSTEQIVRRIGDSKFAEQLHLVLLDGITFGGCNVVDLEQLSKRLQLPVAAVMRRRPNVERFKAVFEHLPDRAERLRRTAAAGEIHELGGWVFQCQGESPDVIPAVLDRLTNEGKVPEALRLAHLIGSAIKLGQSSNRA